MEAIDEIKCLWNIKHLTFNIWHQTSRMIISSKLPPPQFTGEWVWSVTVTVTKHCAVSQLCVWARTQVTHTEVWKYTTATIQDVAAIKSLISSKELWFKLSVIWEKILLFSATILLCLLDRRSQHSLLPSCQKYVARENVKFLLSPNCLEHK